MNVNDYVQIGGVALAIVLCAIWIIRRINLRRMAHKKGYDKCSGCELKDMCCNNQKCDR